MSRSNHINGSLEVKIVDTINNTNCEYQYTVCMKNLQHISNSNTPNNLHSTNANTNTVLTNLTTLCGDHYLKCAMKSNWWKLNTK